MLYGNREAFRSLAQFMSWIADANPADHYECHVKWHLSSEEALLRGGTPNVVTVIAPELATHLASASDMGPGFEVTFMAVEEHDLDAMSTTARCGVKPE